MSVLTNWVDQLQARVEKIEESRRAVIPPERFNSAAVFLEQLVVPYGTMSRKYRYARVVTDSDAGVGMGEVTDSLQRLLRADFTAFVRGHLSEGTSGLGDQVRALKSVVEAHIRTLDAHVEEFHKGLEAEIEGVHVQVKLFKALSLADKTAEFDKLQMKFAMLRRQFGQNTAASLLTGYREAVLQELGALQNAVTFDERLNLSKEALGFVRRILAGGNKAPTLLELTPSLLAEIQKLREFAGTVRIQRF